MSQIVAQADPVWLPFVASGILAMLGLFCFLFGETLPPRDVMRSMSPTMLRETSTTSHLFGDAFVRAATWLLGFGVGVLLATEPSILAGIRSAASA